MVEHYKSPIKLICSGCRGEGKLKPINVFEQFRDVFEKPCDICNGLGYVIEMQASDHPFNKDKKKA